MISTFSIPSNFSRNIFHQSGAANFFLRIFSFEFFIRICILWPAKVEILSLLRVWGLSGWFRAVGSRGMRILWPQSRPSALQREPANYRTNTEHIFFSSFNALLYSSTRCQQNSYWSTFCIYWFTTLSSRVWGALQTLFGYFDVEIIPQENSKFPFLSYSWTTYSYFHSGFRKSLSCKHLIRQTLLDNVEDDDDGGDNGDDDGDKWKSGAGISFIDQTEFFRQKTHHQPFRGDHHYTLASQKSIWFNRHDRHRKWSGNNFELFWCFSFNFAILAPALAFSLIFLFSGKLHQLGICVFQLPLGCPQ